MQDGKSSRGGRASRWLSGMVVAALIVSSRIALAETSWLPETRPVPILVADPYEPRMAIAYFPADEHLHATLGGLFPMVSVRKDSLEVTASLVGGAWLELRIEDNVFPMETVDGAFGLRIDAAKDVWLVTMRATHWSAHRADGDSTVQYPPSAVSREYGTIEVGLQPGSFYGFARIGAAWHSVPERHGAIVAAGIQWSPRRGTWRPVAAAHYEDDPARGDAPTWFLFAGAETGPRPLRLGFCWWKGPGPGGQHFEQRVNRFGVEMQFTPLSR